MGLYGTPIISVPYLSAGKHTKNYGTSPFVMGKSTISMTIFNSKLLNYQRVNIILGMTIQKFKISWHQKVHRDHLGRCRYIYIYIYIYTYGGFLKWGYHGVLGVYKGKSIYIWGYPYFRKPPYVYIFPLVIGNSYWPTPCLLEQRRHLRGAFSALAKSAATHVMATEELMDWLWDITLW